jgi:arylformamidase
MSDSWRTWSRDELEREYSPSRYVASFDHEMERYAAASAEARRLVPPVTVAYGRDPDETIDLHLPVRDGSVPLLVYLHGGYWQALSKLESSFMAPGLVADRIAVAVVDYTLAPTADVETIVDQCCRAVRVAMAHPHVDPARVVVTGSSAGGHLTTMVARTEPIRGAVPLSGVFDLVPLLGTYVNDALGLDEPRAAALSPLRLAASHVEHVVAVGAQESAEFHRQSADFAAHLAAAGVPTVSYVIEGRHHFDLPFDLADGSTVVGAAVRRMLTS